MVRWLEKKGYDVTYATSVDTHEKADLFLSGTTKRHKGFLSVGHDEYWSWQMRDRVEQARDNGVSLGFFSSKICYWQVRFEASLKNGRANRTMVSYKYDAELRDPYYLDADPSNDRLVTTWWRESPVNRPEASMVGVMFAAASNQFSWGLDDYYASSPFVLRPSRLNSKFQQMISNILARFVGDQFPVARPGWPYSGVVGSAVSFNGKGSSDADGTIFSYAWNFGDGATGKGSTTSHAFALTGTYVVNLVVIDDDGAAHSSSTTVVISNPTTTLNAPAD